MLHYVDSNVRMVPISQIGNWKLMTNIPGVLEGGMHWSPGHVGRSPGHVVKEPRLGGAGDLAM